MSSTVEQIKERLGIVDVVSTYVKLERAGKNLKARCPFHNEKTPSFFVSPERGSYHCFGCGRGGDIFSFVEEFDGLDFVGALRVLADRAGVELEPIDPKKKSERERLFGLLEAGAVFFEKRFVNNKEAQAYIQKRAVTPETAKLFRLGYAPDDWRVLYTEFTEQKGYTEGELLKVGLIKKGERGKPYDTFRGRLMFPIRDAAGRVIAFSGRILDAAKDTDAPKYLNTPETSFFNKSAVLYGFDMAKHDIRKYDFCSVVEGQMDVLLTHQVGYRNTVAPLGTALTSQHLDRLRQITQNLVLAFDADEAGIHSFRRAAAMGLARGFDVKVTTLPEGKDPADIITEDADAWRGYVKQAVHAVDFLLTVLSEEHTQPRAFAKAVTEQVLPLIARIENKIDQSHFIKQVAEKLSVSEDAVREELGKVRLLEEEAAVAEVLHDAESTPESRRDELLYRTLGMLSWQEDMEEPMIDVVGIRKRLKEIVGDDSAAQLSDSEARQYAFDAELSLADSEDLEHYVDDLLRLLESEVLQEELQTKLSKLKQAEADGDTKLSEKLTAACQKLAQKIESLKHIAHA